MPLSEEEAELVRESYHAIASDSAAASASFYRHLFAIAPGARSLFVVDLQRQGVKLMSTLGLVVAQIQDWDALTPLLEALALRHLAYGVKTEHYVAMAAALQAMLDERLGERLRPEVAAAWEHAYSELTAAMIAVGYPSTSTEF